MNWLDRPLDASYLLDSGLLFEANRQFFHLVGLAIVAKQDEQGKVILTIKDYRANPEQALFSKEIRDKGRLKFRNYMKAFGYSQIDKRAEKLGVATQWVPPEIGA